MSDLSQDGKYTPQTSCLVSHYQRLLARWQTTATAVTMEDIAQELGCNRRYTRLLLQSMMARQWLSWTGLRGRGGRGRLHCRVRDVAVQEQQAIFTAPGESCADAGTLRRDNDSRLCVSFYRPIDAIMPSDHTGRVERHLLGMVHAGLTCISDAGVPVPDVAMATEISPDALTWRFPLRSGLVWHSGEPVDAGQLLQTLRGHLTRPTFAHVQSAERECVHGTDILILKLSRPDAMLAYRLADPVHGLSHPAQGENGLGPFALRRHTDQQLLLEASDHYHRRRPHIRTVEYRIEARLPGRRWTSLVLTHPDDTPDSPLQRHIPGENAGFIYLTFNVRRGNLNLAQQRFIQALAKVALRDLDGRENVSAANYSWSDVAEGDIPEVVPLPFALTLGYFWVPETEVLMKSLQRQLRYWGCELELRPVDANLWFLPEKWDSCDMGVSDLRFQRPWWFAPETRFHHSVMLMQFMSESLHRKGERLLALMGRNETRYAGRVKRVMQWLVQSGCIYPLFRLNFDVWTGERFQGVKVLPQGWPDFTQIRVVSAIAHDEELATTSPEAGALSCAD